MRSGIIFLLTFLNISFTIAQNTEIIRESCSENIKSILFYKKGFPLSYPVFEAGDENPLVLSFDDLGNTSKNYYYSVILCDADWTESRLSPSEYSSGLFSFAISNYQVSSNTLVHFLHYELEIPNSDLQLNYSGNYIIKIFENSDSDQPVLVKRFVFVDTKVKISGQYKIPSLPEFRSTSQQINFSILHPDFPISNPRDEVKVVILKNFDWNTSLSNLKPLFIGNGVLDYNYDKENLFVAGNEYRSFNINSRKYPSPQVIGIDYDGKSYITSLNVDKTRYSYSYKEDINGLYYIENKDVRNPDNSVESDYFEVKFSLQTNLSPEEGDIFIYGALTNRFLNENTLMKYNAEKSLYEGTLFLKQGYYEYQYVFMPKNQNSFSESELEGSFSETENNYFILVYYRGFGDRYDKLIGYKRFTQLNK
jgi:hypothetical protein